MKQQRGFTLIELLIVIVIIGILAAVVFVALDPAKRFADARNARRWSEVRSVLDAVLKYQVDNNGSLPTDVASMPTAIDYVIGTAVANCDDCTTSKGATSAVCLDIDNGGELVDEYIASLPLDPNGGTAAETRYYVGKSANGRITIGACDAEESATIKVTR